MLTNITLSCICTGSCRSEASYENNLTGCVSSLHAKNLKLQHNITCICLHQWFAHDEFKMHVPIHAYFSLSEVGEGV